MAASDHPRGVDAVADLVGDGALLESTRTSASGPAGQLPLTPEMLLNEPSGNLFGMTQDAGMGWNPADVGRDQFLIVSTQGGLRDADGTPVALGYHTGHWEIGLLVRAAAEALRTAGVVPFAAYCSDPCDGRTQGTTGMFDSLPYRNDAAVTMRRLIRSLPRRSGVMGIATCDKGLPATLLALAGSSALPGIIVPGGVTLPAAGAEDAGKVQTIGARFAHGLITVDDASAMGCRACGTPGGGCQFLGTAATSQVVAEALGLTLPHAALAPSGEPVWIDLARRSAHALVRLAARRTPLSSILTPAAIENAMLVHAAFGGSTNLLLHIPAIAHAAGLPRPTVADWTRVNRATPRLVDALPNGPRNHPTVQVFLAGGVPEVMLHLRRMGLLDVDVPTVTGEPLSAVLDWWESSDRRRAARERLRTADDVDPDRVIMSPDAARREGLTSTVVFPIGNVAPEGSVVKATAIDPSVVGEDGVFRHRGPARVFTSEHDAIAAIKGLTSPRVAPGDILVVIGVGPLGTGMEETYQLTSALKYLPWGKEVAIVTDARFSGVSTGACIGHVGPEALAGGPIGRLVDGDVLEIVVDRGTLEGRVDLVEVDGRTIGADEAARILASRPPHPGLAPDGKLPADTRLWAALQQVGGGTWGGCVYDVDRIIEVLEAGQRALKKND
ncbi:MAG TPA: YjhG/YagF family D-xylonate dehydratase [Vicinamibacterales bacterium]|nr:YjhG/YagF family D-xylonate dehydratase [Vicinamibacterales bacterium]